MQSTSSLTIAVAFRPELLAIAGRAVDLLVGTFVAVARVEILCAHVALEASLVPRLEDNKMDTLKVTKKTFNTETNHHMK